MSRAAESVSDIPLTLPTHMPGVDLYIGQTPAMRQVASHILSVARTERTSVLLCGETGSGKELVAGAIHHLSRRATRPFMPINCATIAANLAESELFGSERGAFTDARLRRGVVEAAHAGTLFLDEIAELSLPVQRTLLRFLETRKFRRLGSERLLTADIRIIAATWRDLDEAVAQGTFRADLLFRINVMAITLPPLRQRKEDIPAIVSACLNERSHDTHIGYAPECSPEAIDLLCAYHWPGNVRDLRNVLERALVLSRGETVLPDHLPDAIRRPHHVSPPPQPSPEELLAGLRMPEGGAMLPDLVRLLEETLITQAMERAGGNQSEAARILGLTRDQLRQRLKRLAFR
ncbi:MAG TPA: sigma-54 dependent transcriptional regulator [Ktedonobacterales bacterium]|nr:sigma-54 dependent transcriptional regulator [Ktedonobacterales bacterium]